MKVNKISKKYLRKRTKSEHEKVDGSVETCINCFDVGKIKLQTCSVEKDENGKLVEELAGHVYYCYNCGHVWEVYIESKEVLELGSEFKDYIWKKTGRKPPETKI